MSVNDIVYVAVSGLEIDPDRLASDALLLYVDRRMKSLAPLLDDDKAASEYLRLARARELAAFKRDAVSLFREAASILSTSPERLAADAIAAYIDAELARLEPLISGSGPGADIARGRYARLLDVKGSIYGVVEGSGYGCIVDLHSLKSARIPLRVMCISPVSGDCRVEGALAFMVNRVKPYLLREYKRIGDAMRHAVVEVVDGACGRTVVSVREDGALVLVHDKMMYSGVHELVFRKPVWHYVDELVPVKKYQLE